MNSDQMAKAVEQALVTAGFHGLSVKVIAAPGCQYSHGWGDYGWFKWGSARVMIVGIGEQVKRVEEIVAEIPFPGLEHEYYADDAGGPLPAEGRPA